MRKIATVFIVAVVLLMIPPGWFLWQASQPLPLKQGIEVEIPKGASTNKIAHLLEKQEVIASSLTFRIAARLKGVSADLKSGLYLFENEISINSVLDRLQRGDVMQFQITIPEGLRSDEIIALLAEKSGVQIDVWQQAFIKLLPGQEEGRLLPETYQYTKPINPTEMLTSMISAQKRLLASLSSDPEVQEKLRIAASIIEKETRLDHERPLVSAVIRNRLQKRMPLQMDPTVIYGIWKTSGKFSGNIRKRDLSTDTPWNSYTRRGLPPTPIGNPGAASLRAAAAPADVDYLFFVADGTGGHKFAATHEEHLANVEAWIRIERSRNSQQREK